MKSSFPLGRLGRATRSAVVSGGSTPAGAGTSAAEFDGTNDYLTKTGLTGAADGGKGIISLWVNTDTDGTAPAIYDQNGQSHVQITIDASNRFSILTSDSTGVQAPIFMRSSTDSVLAADGWVHILASWDCTLATPEYHLYISDVEDANTLGSPQQANIDYTESTYILMARDAAAGKFDGCVAEFYFNQAEFLDFSVEANRRKFIDASGKPVSLGDNGETPTGTSPIIYLKDPYDSFEINSGTGGDFTVVGALTECADAPGTE